jgi:PKD repeat protein
MRKVIILLAGLASALHLSAQTQLSGVINHYAAVTAIDTCTFTLTVDETSDFSAGQYLLVIQMQGAVINTSNSAAFGDITDYRSSGRFERARIAAVTGNAIVLEKALYHDYQVAGKVQVVSWPVYDVAVVSGELTAAPWNGSTGGVLAFEVADNLALGADIDVSGKGFRGGQANINDGNDCSWLVNVSAYSYGLNNWRGAAKGEGIAAFLPGQEAGRGAQANGGGGGNDHNSGGGGGANVNGGGNGGENNEPTTFGCDGQFPGRGGKAAFLTPQRLFMGGGGGAGHENNNVGTAGGAGGGMAIIQTSFVSGNGYSIKADGQSAVSSIGDGAGGGGGGGSVYLLTTSIIGPLTVSADGGTGGSVNNAGDDRCHGPGGGGSGGRVVCTVNPAIISVNGGAAGISYNSGACPDSPNGAQAGANGFSGIGIMWTPLLPQGQQPNTPPMVLSQPQTVTACVGQTAFLPVQVTGFDLQLQWQVDNGAGFVNMSNSLIINGVYDDTLALLNVAASQNGLTYRLALQSDCFGTVYSDPIVLMVESTGAPSFSFLTNGLTTAFTNTTAFPGVFSWDFGDGSSSTVFSPNHTYATAGNYTVTLTVNTPCGNTFISQQITVGLPPQALFTSDKREGCTPFTAQFYNTSTGDYDALSWSFPGGQPATSTADEPLVSYELAGVHDVTLVLYSPFGNDTLWWEDYITVYPRPQVAFDYTIDGYQVSFNNLSVNADTYTWDFGDGQNSNEASPLHGYAGPGAYEVTLNAENAHCANAAGQTVFITPTGTTQVDGIALKVYPNPVRHALVVQSVGELPEGWRWQVANWQGIVLDSGVLQHRTEIDMTHLPAGGYMLILNDARGSVAVHQVLKW